MGEAERAMAKATATIEKLTADIAAAGSDHERLTALSNDMAQAQSALDAAEATWLEIAAEAEEAGLDLG